MKNINWDEKINEFDKALKNGLQNFVSIELKKLILSQKVSTEYLPKITDLLRRSGDPLLGTKLLSKFFSKDRNELLKLPSELICSYAACLSALGANQEAKVLLKSIESIDDPNIQLQSGFNLIRTWDYQNSIIYFRNVLKSNKATDYQKLISKVNLLSAYLNTGMQHLFNKEITNAIYSAQTMNAKLLLGNILELRSQFRLNNKEFSAAEHDLKISQKLLNNPSNLYQLILKKWMLFLGFDMLKIKIGPSIQLDSLNTQNQELKNICQRFGYWELYRDCDLQYYIRSQNPDVFLKLYYGTPHLMYRKHLERYKHFDLQIPDNWIFKPSEFLESSDEIYVHTPTKNDPLVKKLLTSLLSDLYAPKSLGGIHNDLFPNEYFSAEHSPHKINQLVYRLRKNLKNKNFKIFSLCKTFKIQTDLKILIRNPELTILDPILQLEKDLLKGCLGQLVDWSQIKNCAESIMIQNKSAGVVIHDYQIRKMIKNNIQSGKIISFKRGAKSKYKIAI